MNFSQKSQKVLNFTNIFLLLIEELGEGIPSEVYIVCFLFCTLLLGAICRIINKKWGVIFILFLFVKINFRLHTHQCYFSLVSLQDYQKTATS